jgi:hypothetical protein
VNDTHTLLKNREIEQLQPLITPSATRGVILSLQANREKPRLIIGQQPLSLLRIILG